MNTEDFLRTYHLSRNGANQMYRHPLWKRLVYSDGIRDLADAGCHWLLDIIGTEVVQAMTRCTGLGILKAVVTESRARLELTLTDDAPPAWARDVPYTDLPEGEWILYLSSDGRDCTVILPNEY
ncbi:MAG TPA: hypothetical protein P5305_04005 [Rubrivivax sp.]|nr:hypothetical protein [Rubrivivax sp.]HRY87026.1 hypothetical protein [Rubrivivax sp.]